MDYTRVGSDISELFERRASAQPAHVAIRDAGRSITFRELAAAVCRCAAELAARCVARGDVVALALPRSAASVAWLLAIWRAGAVYVPIEHASPPARVDALVRHAGAKLRIRPPAHPSPAAALLECLGVVYELALEASAAPEVELPAGCCYILYTSGSTGAPKGVLGSAAGLLLRCEWAWCALPFARGEVVAHKTSLGFVDHLAEVVGTLLAGCALSVLPDALVRDPCALVRALAAERVSRLVVVPALLVSLLTACERAAVEGEGPCLPGLRLVACSGESLPAPLCARFGRLMPAGCRLLNLYGATEVSADVTWHDATPPPTPRQPLDGRPAQRGGAAAPPIVPLGRPLDEHVLVLLRDLPSAGGADARHGGGDDCDGTRLEEGAGAVGEICIGGPYCALGYLADPELTASRFVAIGADELERADRAGHVQPLGGATAVRAAGGGAVTFFRTGDLGRLDGRGVLHYLGRLDEQLKVRGARVEPQEVEACLGAHPSVQQAAVVAWWAAPEDGARAELRGREAPNGDVLVAFVAVSAADGAGAEEAEGAGLAVPAQGSAPHAESAAGGAAPHGSGALLPWAQLRAELHLSLARTLPPHALPAHIVRLERLPLTQSGKLDRRRLRERAALWRAPAPRGDGERAEGAAQGSGGGALLLDPAALRARVRQLVLSLSPALAEAAAAEAAEPSAHAAEAATADNAGTGATALQLDEVPLRAAGISSLGAAQLGHALWACGVRLPMELLLREDCSVSAICAHATHARIGGGVGAVADSAARVGGLLPLPRLSAQGGSSAPPDREGARPPAVPPAAAESDARAIPALAALAHWRFDAGAEPAVLPPVPVASAAELAAAGAYFAGKGPHHAEPSAQPAGAAKWWARANERGGKPDALPCAPAVGRGARLLCAWRWAARKCVDSSALVLQPAGQAALAVVASHSGEVACLELASGARRWQTALPDRVESSAAGSADGAALFVGCYDGCVYALSAADGRLLWSCATGGEVKAAPCVVCAPGGSARCGGPAETVWVGSFDRHIYALDAITGACLLKHAAGAAVYASATSCAAPPSCPRGPLASVLSGDGAACASSADGEDLLILCATLKGRVLAFDAATRGIVWAVELGHAVFASLRADCAAGLVLAGCVDGSLRALELRTGRVRWACETGGPVFATPCVHRRAAAESLYYASSQSGCLVCVGGDGRVCWRARLPGLGGHSAPSTAGDLLVIGSTDGWLHLLSASTGAQLDALRLPGAVHSSPVLCALHSRVVVGCRDSSAYCLQLAPAPLRPARMEPVGGQLAELHGAPCVAAAAAAALGGGGSGAVGAQVADERAGAARLQVLSRVLGNLAG